MAVFKCKMCGGSLEVQEGMSVCECEYCGTKQTLPRLNDERRANLYDRANHFRRNNEFDKAMSMYEQILEEDKGDAEAYWSLVLCTYGIEYVEDPASHKRLPTVNRTQFISVYADENYKAALQYADESQRQIYEMEAGQIDGIQKQILSISNQEEPFDVFICYKETDDQGKRTQDSVLANDLYHQLTNEGFKVFFARITLEDKLGSAYEPYIFAALNSAKVMVVLGTRAEYFNAVWVRNEWSRYLALMKNDAKKVLVPAYKDMDPYDLPQEFSHLQAQDMGKLGFMQDLIRGIRKLTGTAQPIQSAAAAATAGTAGNETAPLLRRAFLFLEDGDFAKADEYCERVLNLEPENAEAYMGKLMVQLKVRKRENLAQNPDRLDQTDAFRKIMRFGGEAIKSEAEGYNRQIIKRQEEEAERQRKEEERQRKLKQEQEEKQREEAYQGVLAAIESAATSGQLKAAIANLQAWKDYKDAAARIAAAEEKLAQFKKKEKAKRKRKGFMAAMAVVVVILAGTAFYAIHKQIQYIAATQRAESLLQEGEYVKAYSAFVELMDEKRAEEAREKLVETLVSEMLGYIEDENYGRASELFSTISRYGGAYKTKNDIEARKNGIGDYGYGPYVSPAKEYYELLEPIIQVVERHAEAGEYDELKKVVSKLNYTVKKAAEERLSNAIYQAEAQCLEEGKYAKAESLLSLMGDWIPDKYRLFVKKLQLRLAQAEIGDRVTFGKYHIEADAASNYSNRWSEVEWYVLDKKESGEVLLWCKNSLEFMDNEAGGWKDSTLRKWLNKDFYQTCFNEEEQAVIVESVLQNEQLSNISYISDTSDYFVENRTSVSEISSGEGIEKQLDETKDKVFLLSASEFVQYMRNNTDETNITNYRTARANTPYVEKHYSEYISGDISNSYFLRSSMERDGRGYFSGPALGKDFYGVYYFESMFSKAGVRPAIWVKPIE